MEQPHFKNNSLMLRYSGYIEHGLKDLSKSSEKFSKKSTKINRNTMKIHHLFYPAFNDRSHTLNRWINSSMKNISYHAISDNIFGLTRGSFIKDMIEDGFFYDKIRKEQEKKRQYDRFNIK